MSDLTTNSEDARVVTSKMTEVSATKKPLSNKEIMEGAKLSSENSINITSFIRSKFGPFKFKDVDGRRGFEISDKKGTPFVVQRIVLSKVPTENNHIEVVLIMPNPEEIEIVKAKKEEK